MDHFVTHYCVQTTMLLYWLRQEQRLEWAYACRTPGLISLAREVSGHESGQPVRTLEQSFDELGMEEPGWVFYDTFRERLMEVYLRFRLSENH